MTLKQFRNHIIKVCEQGEIPIRLVRKAKRFDGYYVYHVNGESSLVVMNDDYYSIANMLKKFNCTKPIVVRIL